MTPNSIPVKVLRVRTCQPFAQALLAAVLALPLVALAQHASPPVADSRQAHPQASRWQLEDLIRLTWRTHPSVRSQQALLAAAETGVESARWQYFPTPSVSVQAAGVGQGDTSYQGDRQVTVLALSQPLWTWGRLDAGLERSVAQRDSARASQHESRLSLALRMVQSWGEWQAAQARQQAQQEGVGHHERLLHQVRRRFDEGQAAASDLNLAEGRLAALRADLAYAAMQERTARERLALLSGQELAPGTLSEPSVPALPTADSAELLRRVLDASPALARLQAQLRVQQHAVAELEARLKPELSARLESQHGNFSVAGVAAQTRVLITLNTQLGPGLSSLTAVTEALQRIESAQADIETQRLMLAEQVATDWQLLVTAPARRLDLVQAIGSADGVQRSWDRQYLAGRKTWQDLMGAAREQVQARIQLAEFDAAHLMAAWRLGLLAGGLDSTTQDLHP